MSAYVVDIEHIHALVVAGLALDELAWFERDLERAAVEEQAHEPGLPFTWRQVELAGELKRELTPDTAGRVGAMLWAQNVASVNHRYAEEELEDVYEPPADLLWRVQAARARLDPARVLGAVGCYEYQSCEGPSWSDSEACQFVDALRRGYIRRLAGYRAGEVHELAELYRREVTA